MSGRVTDREGWIKSFGSIGAMRRGFSGDDSDAFVGGEMSVRGGYVGDGLSDSGVERGGRQGRLKVAITEQFERIRVWEKV